MSTTIDIKMSAAGIFPLACPVQELRWIPDWQYELVYSESGVNEHHCVFKEEKLGPFLFGRDMPTTWVTNQYDPLNTRVLFQLTVGESAVVCFEFRGEPVEECLGRGPWKMVYTGLNEVGNGQRPSDIRTKLEMVLDFLSQALKHYCATGKIIGN